MLGESKDHGLSCPLAVVLSHDAASLPLLKTAYRNACDDKQRLTYAKVLGISYPRARRRWLPRRAHSAWDLGMALTSQRDTGNMYSDLDRVVIALGFSRAPESPAPLLRKLAQLTPRANCRTTKRSRSPCGKTAATRRLSRWQSFSISRVSQATPRSIPLYYRRKPTDTLRRSPQTAWLPPGPRCQANNTNLNRDEGVDHRDDALSLRGPRRPR